MYHFLGVQSSFSASVIAMQFKAPILTPSSTEASCQKENTQQDIAKNVRIQKWDLSLARIKILVTFLWSQICQCQILVSLLFFTSTTHLRQTPFPNFLLFLL